MSWSVFEVSQEFIHSVWPSVEQYIHNSVKYANGDITLDEVKSNIVHGNWIMYVALDTAGKCHGVAVVSFFNRINARVAYVVASGGRLLYDADTFAKFCELLRLRGATAMEAEVRDSMLRLLARRGAYKKANAIAVAL